jgi:hypothetical protein
VRARLPWLILLALSPTAFAAASTPPASIPPEAVLEGCAQSPSPTGRPLEGLEQLETLCPGLTQALSELGLAQQIGEEWRGRLNLLALGQLADLQRYYDGAPRVAAPRVEALASVASSLRVQTAPQSWWQRFKSWLRSLLRQDEAPSRADFGWLERLLSHLKLKPWLAQAVGYTTIGLVIALALWIIWRELRQAKVFTRHRKAAGRIERTGWMPPAFAPDLRGADLDALPLWDRPAVLLQLLVQALRQSDRLGLERALTFRELSERVKLDDDLQRTRFERVARLAERQRYGVRSQPPSLGSDEQLRETLADGLSLYAQLRATAGAHP